MGHPLAAWVQGGAPGVVGQRSRVREPDRREIAVALNRLTEESLRSRDIEDTVVTQLGEQLPLPLDLLTGGDPAVSSKKRAMRATRRPSIATRMRGPRCQSAYCPQLKWVIRRPSGACFRIAIT